MSLSYAVDPTFSRRRLEGFAFVAINNADQWAMNLSHDYPAAICTDLENIVGKVSLATCCRIFLPVLLSTSERREGRLQR